MQLLGLGVLAVALGIIGLLVARARPRLAFIGWSCVLAFVPIWVTIPGPLPLPLVCVTAAAVVVCVWPPGLRPSLVDLLAAGAMVGPLVATLATPTPISVPLDVLQTALFAYLLGRVVPAAVGEETTYRTLSVVMGIASALALVEWVTHANPFLAIPPTGGGSSYWMSVAYRGDTLRAEGAFGHPIALGSVVAMTMPMVLATRLRLFWKLLLLAVMGAAIVVTFSRIGLVSAALGVVIMVMSRRTQMRLGQRLAVLVSLGAATAVALPYVGDVLDSTGDEAAGSAEYRQFLFDLVPSIDVLGMSPARVVQPDGVVTYGRFVSIDNQMLLEGLRYGWVVLGLFAAVFAVAAARSLLLRATAATAALAAQIPAAFSVAHITQYGFFVWVVMGLATATELPPVPETAITPASAPLRSLVTRGAP